MARRGKLTTEIEKQYLQVIIGAAIHGDEEAEMWLHGQGYIYIDNEHSARFIYYSNKTDRFGNKAAKWREAVFKRDKYRCVECGKTGRLNAHHIESWADYPAMRFDVNNGITLCVDCHAKKHPDIANLIKKARYKVNP